jgi:hypothetical protein
MEIISIREAEKRGLTHYFTGKPCCHGHLSPRYVSTWRCVQCTINRVLSWQASNPEKKRAKQRRYQDRKPKDRKLAESRRDHQTERQRREARLAAIAGRPRPDTCDICREKNTRRNDVIAFDHCHTHGHFRGWLCDRCNTVLGSAEDNPSLLRQMADYLERTTPNNDHKQGQKAGIPDDGRTPA